MEVAVYPSAVADDPSLRQSATLLRVLGILLPGRVMRLTRVRPRMGRTLREVLLGSDAPIPGEVSGEETSTLDLRVFAAATWRPGGEGYDFLRRVRGRPEEQIAFTSHSDRTERLALYGGPEEHPEEEGVRGLRVDPTLDAEGLGRLLLEICELASVVDPQLECDFSATPQSYAPHHPKDRLFVLGPRSPSEGSEEGSEGGQGELRDILGPGPEGELRAEGPALFASHSWLMPDTAPGMGQWLISQLLRGGPAGAVIAVPEGALSLWQEGAIVLVQRHGQEEERIPYTGDWERPGPGVYLQTVTPGTHGVELFFRAAIGEPEEGPHDLSWVTVPAEGRFGWLEAGAPERCEARPHLEGPLEMTVENEPYLLPLSFRAELRGGRLCLSRAWWQEDSRASVYLTDERGRSEQVVVVAPPTMSFALLVSALFFLSLSLMAVARYRPTATGAVLKEERPASFREQAGRGWTIEPIASPRLGLGRRGPLAWIPKERSLIGRREPIREGVDFEDPEGKLWCLVDTDTAEALRAGRLEDPPLPRRRGPMQLLLPPLFLVGLSVGLPMYLGLGSRLAFLALCLPLFLLGGALLFGTRFTVKHLL